ncbi:MAG: hypothetical protein ACI4EP_07980 [Suilimivivens sp.]|nr:hypothetical protein [Lachnospiraceae bacterium]MDY5869981.1 hypothetical protein [Lachnospiraceae bacterium]
MKKLKLFAPFLMLLSGAIASIMMFYFQYPVEQMLPRLLIVLIVFYIAGCFIQKKIISFVEQIKEEEEKEGEVIEKEIPDESGEEIDAESSELRETQEKA